MDPRDFPRNAFYLHLTVMVLHDAIADRQTQTRSFSLRLGREEGIEDCMHGVLRYPNAAILNGRSYPLFSFPAVGSCQNADALVFVKSRISFVQRVSCVCKKVDDDLLNLLAAALSLGQVVVNGNFNGDLILSQ